MNKFSVFLWEFTFIVSSNLAESLILGYYFSAKTKLVLDVWKLFIPHNETQFISQDQQLAHTNNIDIGNIYSYA